MTGGRGRGARPLRLASRRHRRVGVAPAPPWADPFAPAKPSQASRSLRSRACRLCHPGRIDIGCLRARGRSSSSWRLRGSARRISSFPSRGRSWCSSPSSSLSYRRSSTHPVSRGGWCLRGGAPPPQRDQRQPCRRRVADRRLHVDRCGVDRGGYRSAHVGLRTHLGQGHGATVPMCLGRTLARVIVLNLRGLGDGRARLSSCRR